MIITFLLRRVLRNSRNCHKNCHSSRDFEAFNRIWNASSGTFTRQWEYREKRERMWSGIIKLNAVTHSSPFSRVWLWLYVVAAVCSKLWRSRVVVSYWSDGSFMRMGHGTIQIYYCYTQMINRKIFSFTRIGFLQAHFCHLIHLIFVTIPHKSLIIIGATGQ